MPVEILRTREDIRQDVRLRAIEKRLANMDAGFKKYDLVNKVAKLEQQIGALTTRRSAKK